MCKPELTEEEFNKNITPIVQVRWHLWRKSNILTIQMKAIEQLHVVLLKFNVCSAVFQFAR